VEEGSPSSSVAAQGALADLCIGLGEWGESQSLQPYGTPRQLAPEADAGLIESAVN